MNTNLQMALRISGTKQRRAGFAPLVIVGVLQGGEGDNMDRSAQVSEKPSFVVKHTSDYNLYMLIDRRVKSFDADAPGVLSIAITISSGAQLANGKSPYTLLNEVYTKFVTTYMTPVSDGRDSFVDTEIDKEIFSQILNQYPLEPRAVATVPMNPQGPTGIVCVGKDKLEQFFRDTQYPEFAHFKDIEIGSECQSQVSEGLSSLQIPRPVSYEVIENGGKTGVKLTNPTDSYTTRQKNTTYVEYENITFTLMELLTATDYKLVKGESTVELDPVACCIRCNVHKSNVKYFRSVWIVTDDKEDKEYVNELLKSGKLKLLVNGSQVSPNTEKVDAIETSNAEVRVEPSKIGDLNLFVKQNISKENKEWRITITAKKPAPVRKGGYSGGGNNKPADDKSVKPSSQGRSTPDTTLENGNSSHSGQTVAENTGGIDKKALGIGFLAGLVIGGLLTFAAMSFFGGSGDKKESPQKPQAQVAEVVEDSKPISDNPDGVLATVDPTENPQGVQTGTSTSEAPTDSKTPNLEEADAARQAAIEKAEKEKQAKEQAAAKERAKQEIVNAIKARTKITDIRKLPAWNSLSKNERGTVEAVLDRTKYKQDVHKGEINSFLDNGISTLTDWNSLVNLQRGIWSIQKNDQ